jgi:ParB/RepB/Spo0J family partition protein
MEAGMMSEAIQYLAIERVSVEPQVRKRVNREVVHAMAKTIGRIGLMGPIRVRRVGERFIVVDGHLRLLAAKLAGLKSIAVIIEDGELSEGEVIERQLIANRRREELRPLDFAEAIERLIAITNWTSSEVAEQLGEPVSKISCHRAMLKLPAEIRARIDSGEIPASSAYELTHARDESEQAQLAAEVADHGLTRAGLIKRLKEKRRSPQTPTSGGKGARKSGPSVDRHRFTLPVPPVGSNAELMAWLEELMAVVRDDPAAELVAIFDKFKAIAKRGVAACSA